MTGNGLPEWHSLIEGTESQIAALKSGAKLTVVSAGAGTGKTQTLSQRFAWLLASDPACGVNEILVLTFTKKAAAEMLDRIKKTLERWYEKYPADLAHLKDRIEGLDDAYISTIHAFSMRLIRESGLALDIDPASVIMPEPKKAIWWNEFESALSSSSFEKIKSLLPEEWRERSGGLFAERDFTDTVNALTPKEIAKAACICAEKLYCAGQSAEELWNCDGSALEKDVASARSVRRELYKLWIGKIILELNSRRVLGGSCDINGAQWKFSCLYENWSRLDETDDDKLAAFCEELFSETLKPLPQGRVKTEIESLLGSPLAEWRDEYVKQLAMAEPPTPAEKRVNTLLCKICAVGWACWDNFRRQENLLTQSDLICYASKAVSSSPKYKTKFKHILVDEFQDTDPLQNALIESLRKEGKATLFIVGDQKQSIYRFRNADLSLFRDYTRRAMDDGEAKYIPLGQNFRTAGALLEKFNAVFGNMWGKSGSPVMYESLAAPENNEAAARRDTAEVPYKRFEIIRACSSYADGKKKDDLSLMLYSAVGREFCEMVKSEAPVWDKDKKDFRPVKWSDFAVLVRARTEYSGIERAFERLGLPCVLLTSKDYFGRGETGDLVNLVSLLDAPDDPMRLAGWLASPFSGTESGEADELIASALARKKRNEPLPLAEAVWEKRPDIMERLDGLRRRALLCGVSEALLSFLKEPRFLENFDGRRRLRVNANIAFLANIASEYERSEDKSLHGCADYLRIASSQENAQEEPDIFGDEVEAVRVMTVHAAKGLEFPVVALAVSEGKSRGLPSVIVSKKYGAAANNYPDFLKDKDAEEAPDDGHTAAYRWEMSSERAAEREESDRLLYVGCTRARDRLILCGTYKKPKEQKNKKKNGAKQDFLGGIIESGICESYTELTEDGKEQRLYAAPAAAPSGAELELKAAGPARLARLSASAYTVISWCPAAYRMIYRQGLFSGWTVKGGGGGTNFGVMAHFLLSRWNFDKESVKAVLPAARGEEFNGMLLRLPAELRGEYASDEARARLRSMLERFAETEECSRLRLAEEKGTLRRETRFRVPLNGTTLVGTTDIFWNDEHGFHLRDWKSAPEESAPRFYYEKQLEFYACALNRCLAAKGKAKTPIDSALIYLDTGERGDMRAYDAGAGDFEKIEKEIENAAVRAVTGDFRGLSGRCPQCPWRGACPERPRKEQVAE